MYGRVRECVDSQETEFAQDMECFIQVSGTQLEFLATLYSDHDQKIDEEMTNMEEDSALFTIERSGNAGRPRNEVTQGQIHGLREASWITQHRTWHSRYTWYTHWIHELYERRGNINCKKHDLVNKQINTDCRQLDWTLFDSTYLLVALIFCQNRRSISECIQKLWGVVGLYQSVEKLFHWWKYGGMNL